MADEENTSTLSEQTESDGENTESVDPLETSNGDTKNEGQDETELTGNANPADLNSDQLKAELESTLQELQQAKSKADENWDLLLRARAELDNFRRRAERDLENSRKYGLEKFSSELLPIKDSMELGLDAAREDNQDLEKIREGMELTLKMFAALLEKFEIKEIHPLGEAFDPKYHEAMSMADSEEYGPNTVMQVFQKGYSLYDRLIRPAKVIVVKDQTQNQNDAQDSSTENAKD